MAGEKQSEQPVPEEEALKKGGSSSNLPAAETTPSYERPQIKRVGGEGKETPTLKLKRSAKDEPRSAKQKEKRSKTFSDEEVARAWSDFGAHRREGNAGEMEQLVLNRKLERSSEHELTIFLNSDLELAILDKIEVEMLSFLRDRLENDHISLAKKVVEQQTEQKLYTSTDKYEYLLKQNPKLKDLKDRLGLDFEF